ncbi:UNVERIFIED_CONTAM: hypothetical protein FKN15_070153 [Acipenser sinensis]
MKSNHTDLVPYHTDPVLQSPNRYRTNLVPFPFQPSTEPTWFLSILTWCKNHRPVPHRTDGAKVTEPVVIRTDQCLHPWSCVKPPHCCRSTLRQHPAVDVILQRSHCVRESTKELVRPASQATTSSAQASTRPQQPQRLAQPAAPVARGGLHNRLTEALTGFAARRRSKRLAKQQP